METVFGCLQHQSLNIQLLKRSTFCCEIFPTSTPLGNAPALEVWWALVWLLPISMCLPPNIPRDNETLFKSKHGNNRLTLDLLRIALALWESSVEPNTGGGILNSPVMTRCFHVLPLIMQISGISTEACISGFSHMWNHPMPLQACHRQMGIFDVAYKIPNMDAIESRLFGTGA